MTIKQAAEYIASLEDQITGYKEKINECVKEMQKAAKKGDMDKVKFQNSRITRHFKAIEDLEEMMEKAKLEQEKAEAVEEAGTGFECVMEFLEDLYKKDLEWFEDLKLMNPEDLVKETKAVQNIAKLTRAEAEKEFQRDIITRFYKLATSIKLKAGENILECQLKRNQNNGLDGVVTGDKATVKVQTVLAGGENVQRLHYRTLVK